MNKLMTTAWDDFDVEEMSWMPSHTTAQDVGAKELDNGEKLTELDRRGNALADKLAKAGADTHRVPESIRNKIAAQDALIEATVRWAGRATYVANNQEAEPHRDTTATTKSTRAAKLARAKVAEARRRPRVKCAAKAAKRPQALRGHALIKVGARKWACGVCKATSTRRYQNLPPNGATGQLHRNRLPLREH